MAYPYIQAKKNSYGGERSLKSVKYIVIHYTGNNGDTAKNNADYFHNGNTRLAGAHFFVDQKGTVYQTVNIKNAAWSVGGFFTQEKGAGKYYQKCTNANSVSIEMCDCAKKDPSDKMTAAVKQLVKYIQNACPNAKTIIRHWDVNGKSCPARMTGTNNKKWAAFKKAITPAAGSKFTLTGVKAPTRITKGHYFTIAGKITSELAMSRVEIGIVDSTGRKYLYKYDNRNVGGKTTFDIGRADEAMKFRYLAKGSYYYRIWAWDMHGSHKVLEKAFKVV